MILIHLSNKQFFIICGINFNLDEEQETFATLVETNRIVLIMPLGFMQTVLHIVVFSN